MPRYGDGNVYLKPNGRWEARMPDPRGGYRYVTGTDEDEVRRRWREMLRQRDRTTSYSPRRSGERVRDYLARWLRDTAPRRLRPRTLAGHTAIVENHLVPRLGRYRLVDLHQSDVERMVGALSTTHAAQTVHNVVHVLSAALQAAVREGTLDRNVARLVQLPSRTRSEPIASLTTTEVRRFLEATRGHRHWPIWAFAFATGMRRGEVLGLRWADIDEHAGTVSVNGTFRRSGVTPDGKVMWRREPVKTARSRRVLSMPALARTALRVQKAKATSATLVFARRDGQPLDPDHVTKVFTRALEANGFEAVRFHSLRHSAAQAMLDRLGGDLRAVSAQLGHSSITVTSDVYGAAADDARRRATAAMDAATEGMG